MPPIDFSIIIPTYNRPEQLARCLEALTRLDLPHGTFETIVVDDGSDAPLDRVIEPFRARMNLVLITQERRGPAAARNAGARCARGDYVAFTDDDCIPAADWIRAFQAPLLALPQNAVGGMTLNGLPENIYSVASQTLIHFLYSYYNADRTSPRFFASNNIALPARALFLAVGGFDPSFPPAAEDRDLCDRWLLKGNRFVYVPEGNVRHEHSLTFRAFVKQHWDYGRGALHFHRARARRGQSRMRFEPPRFYVGLLRFPFSQQADRAVLISALLVLSQIATILGFIGEWFRFLKINRNQSSDAQ